MILPFFGTVGERRYIICGQSYAAGFLLYVYDDQNNKHVASILCPLGSDHRITRGNSPNLAKSFCAIAFFLTATFLAFSLPTSHLGDYAAVFTHLVSLAVFLLFSTLLAELVNVDNSTRHWHATEHKSVALLESDLPITLQNLKKMPATHIRCGTAVLALGNEVLIGTWLLTLDWLGVLPLSLAELWLVIIFTLSAYAARRMMFLNIKRFSPLLSLLMIPGLCLPLLLERLMALRNPKNEHLEQAIIALRNFKLSEWLRGQR